MNKIDIKQSGNLAAKGNREATRTWIAKTLVIGMGIVVLLAFSYLLFGNTTPEKSEVVKWVITTFVGVLGTVLGFYFGGEK